MSKRKSTSFPERDWRYLSRLKPIALERLCRRILDEAQAVIATRVEQGAYQAYLALYDHVQKSDRLVAHCFDHWSRSWALTHLIAWRKHHLITDEEFAGFSEETRATVDFLLSE